jgi:hypothetical protein
VKQRPYTIIRDIYEHETLSRELGLTQRTMTAGREES